MDLKPIQRPYLMDGASSIQDMIPPGYLYVTVQNNTPYAVQLFKDSDKTLSARVCYQQPWSSTTWPVPPGFQNYLLDWSGSEDADKVVLLFTTENLGININLGGPSNQGKTEIINTPNVNPTDRADRVLGHVDVDSVPPVEIADGQSVDITDRTGRDMGKFRLMDSGGALIAGKQGHKETATGVEEKTVKLTPGRVFSAIATVDATINDGAGVPVYFLPAKVPVSFGLRPLECADSIRVGFSGAGDAYLQYE